MAIQDLINEVNSIQTKKQAIKEAITAKGVTSEGKLSKFADEIKQISTGEPYWCVLNRYRLDNGKEGVCARTNLDGINYYFIASNSQTKYINMYPDGYIRTMNGSAFSKKEQACCFIEPFNPRSDKGFDNVDNTYKISDTYAVDKSFTFTDFKNYNQYLKPYKENVLVNHNAVYISTTCKDGTRFGDITDKLDANNSSLMFYPNGTSEPIEYVTKIDSTTFIQMAKSEDFSKAGFIKIGNESPVYINLRCERIYGRNKSGLDYSRLLSKIYNDTTRYDSLPLGNYMWLSCKDNILIAVFVGINYIVDINGNKKKNIEIYPYTIFDDRDSNINSYRNGDAIEFYFNISQQGQKQLQQASSTRFFRRQVLKDNGTPEPNATKFLNGYDMLICYQGGKVANNLTVNIQNYFKQHTDRNSITYRYSTGTKFKISYNEYSSLIPAQMLSDIYNKDSKVTGFIRIGEDMSYVELQKITNPEKKDGFNNIGHLINDFIFLPNGFGLSDTENKAMFLTKINGNLTEYAYTIKKNDNTEISTRLYPTNTIIPVSLYLTSDTNTQNYIKSKPLSDIWTEIQDVSAHRDDFEAYNE